VRRERRRDSVWVRRWEREGVSVSSDIVEVVGRLREGGGGWGLEDWMVGGDNLKIGRG
jgi:hypothetical protein